MKRRDDTKKMLEEHRSGDASVADVLENSCSTLKIGRRFGRKFSCIFMVEEYARQEASLEMKATRFSETTVNFFAGLHGDIPRRYKSKLLFMCELETPSKLTANSTSFVILSSYFEVKKLR
jgi:hypothetical protein